MEINPKEMLEWGKWPAVFSKDYISATICPIYLKPGWKFKFVSCLEIQNRKLINLEGPFSPKVSWN